MSSTYEKYIASDIGRTFVISTILVLLSGYLAIAIPLAPANADGIFSFMYKDVTLPDEERFNLALVILEALLLSIFYFFLVVAFGSYAEIQNRLPSWGEVTLAAIITIIASYLLPQISVGDVSGGGGSGYNHFTTPMRTWVFVGTLLGMTLMTLYLFYSEESQNN